MTRTLRGLSWSRPCCRAFEAHHQFPETFAVVNAAEYFTGEVVAREGRTLARQVLEHDLRPPFDSPRVSLANLLKLPGSLGVFAARRHLLDRLAEMAGRLQFDALLLVAAVIDANIMAGAEQMFVGQIGPMLAPLF